MRSWKITLIKFLIWPDFLFINVLFLICIKLKVIWCFTKLLISLIFFRNLINFFYNCIKFTKIILVIALFWQLTFMRWTNIFNAILIIHKLVFLYFYICFCKLLSNLFHYICSLWSRIMFNNILTLFINKFDLIL